MRLALVNKDKSPAECNHILRQAAGLVEQADTPCLVEAIDVFGWYNAPVVRPFMQKACNVTGGRVKQLSFKELARVTSVFHAFAVGTPDFYMNANQRMVQVFEEPTQEEIGKISNVFCESLAEVHEKETVYWPMEAIVKSSEHLVTILQGYVRASKGSEQFYTHTYQLIQSNLEALEAKQVGLVVHFLGKLDVSVDVAPFEKFLLTCGDFEVVVGAIQDFIALKHECRPLIEAAIAQLSQAKSLLSLNILEYALKLHGLPTPDQLKHQRRVAFFLSTASQRAQDLYLRYKLSQFNKTSTNF